MDEIGLTFENNDLKTKVCIFYSLTIPSQISSNDPRPHSLERDGHYTHFPCYNFNGGVSLQQMFT